MALFPLVYLRARQPEALLAPLALLAVCSGGAGLAPNSHLPLLSRLPYTPVKQMFSYKK